MFSIKKINTGNFKKKISVPKSPHISFSALKVGKKALMFFFSIKRLGKYSFRRTRDFFLLFLFCFSMKVGKKEADWTWRQKQLSVLTPPPPDPVSPAVLYSLPDKVWQYNPLLPKEFKILQIDVMSKLKKYWYLCLILCYPKFPRFQCY